MKLKLVQLVIYFFVLTTVSFAQDVNYTILRDAPNSLPVQLSVDPFYAEMSGASARIGWGLRATVVVKRLVSIHVDYRKAYLDVVGAQHVDGELMSPLHEPTNNGLNKEMVFELGGTFHLIDKIKSRDLKVVLHSSSYSSGGYTYTNSKFITVPGTVRNIFGLRGGLNQTNIAVEFSTSPTGPFTATNKSDPTDFTNFGDYTATYHGSSVYNGYTMLNTTSLFVGLSHQRFTNLVVKTDYSKRKKSNASFRDLYFDILFGSVLNFADITAVDGTKFEVTNSAIKKTGWRIGYVFGSSSRSSVTFKTEFGAKPGYKSDKSGVLSNRAYLLLTMGWSIPVKVKFLYAKD